MIKNRSALDTRFVHGKVLLDIADAVVQCLQPKRLVEQHVSIKRHHLYIGANVFDLRAINNIYVVGAGKATEGMAKALYGILGKRITNGYINVPIADTKTTRKTIGTITVNQASHPLPNQAGMRGAQKILKIAESAAADDLVICLISGGGSSILPLPMPGITLKEKSAVTETLLKAGANIFELNAVRKHISAIKGGRLAAAAAPATVISLIISDVLGDPLDVIASGPTVPDHSTQTEALEILDRYKVTSKTIRSVISEHETPKQFTNNVVHNSMIGNNQLALEEAVHHAKRRKITPLILTSMLRGEAKEVAQVLASIAHEIDRYDRPVKKPALLIAGGETTVNVLGKGKGGRNQELVLAAVPLLNSHMTIMSLATDGVDGITPTPVAGAIADGGVAEQCVIKGVNYHEYLYSNDSFNCLKQLGCLLYTGPTGTNVGDVVMILIR